MSLGTTVYAFERSGVLRWQGISRLVKTTIPPRRRAMGKKLNYK
jgi:hypothetical protein